MSALETEVRDLRSRSPSVASGSVSPRNLREGNHDDWQVALGGWFEAKRESIEDEVRAWFERAECLPLEDLHIGGVRANSCRVDLRYMQNNMRERRQVQNLCIEALRAAARASEIPGQQGGKLWAKRNRSPEERARIRAIVTLKALVSQHLSDRDFEFDWRAGV